MLILQPVCTVLSCALVHSNCSAMDSSIDGGFQFSGMCHHVAVQVVSSALKESDTFILKGSGSMKSASFRELTHMWDKGSIFGLLCTKRIFVCVF